MRLIFGLLSQKCEGRLGRFRRRACEQAQPWKHPAPISLKSHYMPLLREAEMVTSVLNSMDWSFLDALKSHTLGNPEPINRWQPSTWPGKQAAGPLLLLLASDLSVALTTGERTA